MKLNIQEFNWAEMFTDSKGRTSPSKVLGFFGGVISLLVFFIAAMDAIFFSLNEFSNGTLTTLTVQALALFTASGTLLGIRRFTKDKEVEKENNL
jgi:hypothetical protein